MLQRPRSELASFGSIAGAETALTREFGRHAFEIAALLRVFHTTYNFRVWVVETVDIELAAHHAVIETSLLLRKIAQGDCRATPQGRQENPKMGIRSFIRMLFGADTVLGRMPRSSTKQPGPFRPPGPPVF